MKKFFKDNLRKCGIYQIKNLVTGQVYIGQSVRIGIRVRVHIGQLKRGKHCNAKFQEDFNKYGINNFELSVLEYVVDEMILGEKEDYYLNLNKLVYNNQNYRSRDVPSLTQEKIDEFWSKVYKKDECWIWQGEVRNKYGNLSINGSKYLAHRISILINNPEKFDKNKIFCHSCNNKNCVNPEHIIPATYRHNQLDLRKVKELKITEEEVKFIRKFWLENKDMHRKDFLKKINKELGKNLVATDISSVITNKRFYDPEWDKHCPTKRTKFQLRGDKCPWSKLNWNIVNYIRNIRNEQMLTASKIQTLVLEKFNIKIELCYLCSIIRNKVWKDKNYICTCKPYVNSRKKDIKSETLSITII